MKEQTVLLDSLIPHPDNPRVISPKDLKKLKASINDFSKMMEARPIVYDENNIILGGNQRYKALLSLGYTDIPSTWCKQVIGWSDAEKKEFLIKDNVSAGDWDWSVLEAWDSTELGDWGLVDEKRHKKKIEKVRLDLEDSEFIASLNLKILGYGELGIALMKQLDIRYFAAFKAEKKIDLMAIKQQVPPEKLLISTIVFLKDFIADFTQVAIITTPSRKSSNGDKPHFASECCKVIAQAVGCTYYDAVFTKNAITAKGTIKHKKTDNDFGYSDNWSNIKEPIIIMFDDILTTGRTLLEIKPLLANKNVFYFILIDNH